MLQTADKASELYAKNLDKVLSELEIKVLATLGNAKTGRDAFDAATILNSRGEFLKALSDAGYNELANQHIAKYPNIIDEVKKDFLDMNLPPVKLNTANVANLKSIAQADLEMFKAIGTKAMDDLRLELFRHSVANRPFSEMVETVKAATVGLTKQARSSVTGELLRTKDGKLYKRSPLANYSYTHANTAVLNFNGEVIREAGEALGAEKWEVVGPVDDVTRDECLDAMGDPVRTAKEWKDAGYWGGSPGGWNCRHQLYPVFD